MLNPKVMVLSLQQYWRMWSFQLAEEVQDAPKGSGSAK